MNKKLFSTAILTAVLLAGCGNQVPYEAQIFPGQEQVMVDICAVNGGFVRGTTSNADRYSGGRYPILVEYRTTYKAECANGATISKTVGRSVVR